MKKALLFCLMLAMTSSMILLTSCNDDDDVSTCTDGIQNGDEVGVDCGGVCDLCPTCDDGIQNGDEVDVDCGGTDCDACPEGIQGKWQSSGTNVAPLLVALFATDSIWIDFRTNNTYMVHQIDTSGAQLMLEGTYTQSESSVAGIWEITIEQSSPAAVTSVGIFDVNNNVMRYEIAQTNPDIGAVPPTAVGGFGSTSGGVFGMTNVQTYVFIE